MPLWSVMIPTYNSERHLAETLESVLRCGVPEDQMQITIVDNCSTDSTKEIMERIGGSRVEWRQNERNLGMVANFNNCIEYAQGELIHVLNSDDLVQKDFYKEFTAVFARCPSAYLVSCRSIIIDDEGQVKGSTPTIPSLEQYSKDVEAFMYDNPFRTPAVVVRREAYQRLGAFDTSLTFCIDWEMWVRVIHSLGGLHLNKELCCYRDGGYNETSMAFRTGEPIKDSERLFQVFKRKGYPISEEQIEKNLRAASLWHYYFFKQLGDRQAAKANKALHIGDLDGFEKLLFRGKETLKSLLGR